jgi:hypothetical protein
MIKKLATALLLLAIAALFVLWFVADLRRNAPVGFWSFVLYIVGALVFVAGAIAVLLPDGPAASAAPNHGGIQPVNDHTVIVDDVEMTVHQVGLLNALRDASQLGADATVRIGTDPVTGEVRYDVVRRGNR